MLTDSKKNKYLSQWEHSQGKVIVRSSPPMLQLAKSNICNFQCVYCFDHRQGTTAAKTELSGEVWQNLEKLIPRAEQLSFHGVGEFMIDPQFFEIVEQAGAAGASLYINTNGSVSTDRHLEILSKYPGELVMAFSIDAATSETYKRIRGKDFEKILGNIRRVIATLKSARSGRSSWFITSYVIVKSNVHEVVPFVKMSKELNADAVRFYPLAEYPGLDWKIETREGGSFDYLSETTPHFREEFTQGIRDAEVLANELGIAIEAPSSEVPSV